jgi:predicted permease
MRGLIEDLRYGLRVLRSSPGPTAVAVLTLALGIAANTTVFGWIDGLLLRPFPGVSNSGRLATLETIDPNGTFQNTSYRDYREYRDRIRQVSGLAGALLTPFTVGEEDAPQRIWGEYVTGNYFAVLGVKIVHGRSLLPEEYGDKPSGYPVAIISERLWKTMFRGDPGVVGRTIRINRHELTLVGVAAPEFSGTVPGLNVELWVPVVMAPELNGQAGLLEQPWQRHLWVTARLKPGVSIAQAGSEVEALAREMAQSSPKTHRGYGAALMPVWKGHYGAHALLLKPLRILMAVCVVLFLIVAANVANLQLARATVRQKEFGIRLAIGAGPWRLVRHLLTESLLMAAIAAVVGLGLSMWFAGSLAWLLPPVNLPITSEFALQPEILGFVVLLCAAAAVLTGLAPAMHCLQANRNDNLKQSASTTTSAGLHRVRGVLVISEVALALVALVGTGLFAESFRRARSIDPGFDARNVLLAQFQVASFCRTAQDRGSFCSRLKDRLTALPGVTSVSYCDAIPLALGSTPWSEVQVEGYVPAPGEGMTVSRNIVAPEFLKTLEIPLLEGRDFTEQDDRNAALVMIVNQSFARRFYGGASPVGRTVTVDGNRVRVVGLAKDSKYASATAAPKPYVYMPYRQKAGGEFWIAFFVKTAGPDTAMMLSIRREGGAVHSSAAVAQVISYEDYIGGALYPQKVAATMLSVLGAVSLLLAAVGLYSVLAFAVSQRRREFGIRMALGAGPREVVGLVIRQGMVLTVAGVAAGTAAALAAARTASGLLVGVSASDPVIYSGAALFLAVVALFACGLPARHATKVDPIVALRQE